MDMGYGHLRAGHALAAAAGIPLRCGDRPPVAGPVEGAAWSAVRWGYGLLSRAAGASPAGSPARRLLDGMTAIPPPAGPGRGAPGRPGGEGGARLLRALCAAGLGSGALRGGRLEGGPLVTTFYAHAVAAEAAGVRDVFCVVTDADIHRVWAPVRAGSSGIRYLVPCRSAARRLRSYGVPRGNIRVTGFPLPPERLGGEGLPVLRREAAERLARLDPSGAFRSRSGPVAERLLGLAVPPPSGSPPRIAFCVGGSGAQAGHARRFLPAARGEILAGRLRVLLVAGNRGGVALAFRRWTADAGLGPPGVEILFEPRVEDYLAAFHARLGEVDLLWTKPSELCFFAALGIPLLLAEPLGAHERRNLDLAVALGAGIVAPAPEGLPALLVTGLRDGSLAACALAGFRGLPKTGTYRVLREIGIPPVA